MRGGDGDGVWDALAAAVRQADDELVGPMTVPSFDDLLGGRAELATRPAPGTTRVPVPEPVQVAGPSLRASWRLAAGLVVAQARLMPRSLGLLTALGLLGAVLMARTAPTPGAAVQLFSAAVTVMMLIGSVSACSQRADPRLELLSAMPISPSTAFGTRLALVLGVDLLLAVAASGVLVAVGHTAGMVAVVAGWLGRALLAASVGAVFAIWRSPAVGTTAGIVVWLLGWGHGPAHGVFFGTRPWMLVAASVLLAAAVRLARRPRLTA